MFIRTAVVCFLIVFVFPWVTILFQWDSVETAIFYVLAVVVIGTLGLFFLGFSIYDRVNSIYELLEQGKEDALEEKPDPVEE